MQHLDLLQVGFFVDNFNYSELDDHESQDEAVANNESSDTSDDANKTASPSEHQRKLQAKLKWALSKFASVPFKNVRLLLAHAGEKGLEVNAIIKPNVYPGNADEIEKRFISNGSVVRSDCLESIRNLSFAHLAAGYGGLAISNLSTELYASAADTWGATPIFLDQFCEYGIGEARLPYWWMDS
jgi:hypothetical protein